MSYPPTKYWTFPEDEKRAIQLLKEIGFWHLSGYSGCLCGNIKIFAWEIEVSCRKSGNTVIVRSNYLGIEKDSSQRIAEEVKRQVIEATDPEPEIVIE